MRVERVFVLYDDDGACFEAALDHDSMCMVELSMKNVNGEKVSSLTFNTEEVPGIIEILKGALEEVKRLNLERSKRA